MNGKRRHARAEKGRSQTLFGPNRLVVVNLTVPVRLIGHACVYGQVIKTRRNNRVIRVERRLKIGTARCLRGALLESEDSETLNTSFVERLNLTIRQGSAYLRRRSPCHARCEDQLRGHVELLHCH